MRIVFMGTPDFAVPSLDILNHSEHQIVGVITSPDSLGGRGGKVLLQSPIKQYAVEHGLNILQPTNLKSPSFLTELRSLSADLQIVVAFRMLPEVVWNMPPLGTFNLHGSLLPKYRGAAPIHHAVMNGDVETGVTSFKLRHVIDTGDVLIQRKLSIAASDTTGIVHDKMMTLGAEVIFDTVQIISKTPREELEKLFHPQNDALVSEAPKLFHHNTKLDFDKEAKTVYNKVRGLNPYPLAWCIISGKETKILTAEYVIISSDKKPYETETDHKKYLHIYCTNGYLSILTLKPEGKRSMTIGEFLNGTNEVLTIT